MRLPEGSEIHMVGVCGVGMAGVACLLAGRGYRVSGCDRSLNALADSLRCSGVTVLEGHHTSHVADLPDNSALIVTTAVRSDEPELVAALARGLPVYSRGEALAWLLSESFGIAVCGTHGKTTTACFTARLFQELGADPGWCIGGFTKELGGVAAPGNNRLLIVEADESDGSLQFYHPSVTVVNNIDLDHLEHFDGEESLVACFRRVIDQSGQGVCVCRDDARAWQAVVSSEVQYLDFGLSASSTLRAAAVEVRAESAAFDLLYQGRNYGRIELGCGGQHNVLNALGAASAAIMCGHAMEAVAAALSAACSQLPGRRFEQIHAVNGVRFIADYAHHPVELKAAVEMALAIQPGRVIAVFQPHRYTRTLALGTHFPAAFRGVDEVMLLPVYAASETVVEGGDICDLYGHFREQLPELRVLLARNLKECWFYLRHTLRSGDLVLIAGAGDIIDLRGYFDQAPECALPAAAVSGLQQIERITVTAHAALSSCSTLPTAGRCCSLVEVEDPAGLQAVLALCCANSVPWRMVGAGMNSWFSDCGFEGIVIRIKSGCLGRHALKGDLVEAECGLNGARLLDWLEAQGLSGLEFLEGVPGTLGGWLAMNAGAHGSEIADCVSRVDFIDFAGQLGCASVEDCGFAYRACELLQQAVAVGCTLKLTHRGSEAVRARRRMARDARIPLQRLRTAGSVFRNPSPESAGRLLDQAGCKGMRVGGAYVTDFHANIIAVNQGATGSDVAALIQKMRNRVWFESKVDLKTEICGVL
ncbi:MAG: UDP-N-acetylmuramate--L-alanine ligase [Kiritimatiellae bacterium]|nr:UDP-N-acetylmuramate--L-alanine ligase [Kiritimatiellia bacterium]